MYWVAVLQWLTSAVLLACAGLSLFKRRPVGIGWGARAKERDERDDYRVSATLSALIGTFWGFMTVYEVTQRSAWFQTACTCLVVGVVALIAIGIRQEFEHRRGR